jgi:hypothetical protein
VNQDMSYVGVDTNLESFKETRSTSAAKLAKVFERALGDQGSILGVVVGLFLKKRLPHTFSLIDLDI